MSMPEYIAAMSGIAAIERQKNEAMQAQNEPYTITPSERSRMEEMLANAS
jgi:isopentenyl diphosphate isomerase/L-lactate dehydrogenase-like FMN-dependent dehydrogenase